LFGGRILFATKNSIYIFEDMDLHQVHEMPNDVIIKSILKIPKGFLALTEDQTLKLFTEDTDEISFIDKGSIAL
jgi:hypothetical protein